MKKLNLALLTAATLAAAPSFAQYAPSPAPSWYIGAGIGRGTLNIRGTDLGLPNAQVGDNTTTYTARLGYRFSPYWAVELGYYDLGEYDFSSGSIAGTAKAKSVGLSVVGILPLGDMFDVYGRLGYANSELKVNASSGKLILCNVDPQIYEVFEITKLNKLFKMEKDEQTALQAF